MSLDFLHLPPSSSLYPNINSILYLSIHPEEQVYGRCLVWIAATARDRPDCTHILIKNTSIQGTSEDIAVWYSSIVDTLASSHRTKLILLTLHYFMIYADKHLRRQKFLEWIENPELAKPSVVKKLIRIGITLLHDFPTERNVLIRILYNSHVMIATISQNAEWFAKKLVFNGDTYLRAHCRKKTTPIVAFALRATSTASKMFLRDRFRSTVRLALFFRNLQKPQHIIYDTCTICWKTQFLWPLHGETRHAVCSRCKNSLRKNEIHTCPLCREVL